MSLKGVHCILGYMEMADHEKCMLEREGPPCGYSPTLLQLMTRTKPERADIKFSPSSLGNCHRRTVLGRQHDWYLEVDSAYRMIRGSVIHEGLAHEPPPPGVLGVIRELKMSTPINVDGEEHTFHGTFDELTLLSVHKVQVVDKVDDASGDTLESHWENHLHVKLVDYKSKSEVLHTLVEPDREHCYQINSYAFMVQQFLPRWLNLRYTPEHEDFPGWNAYHPLFLSESAEIPHIDEVIVDELAIVYLDMRKVRTFTSKGFGYAQGKQLGDYVDGKWRRRSPVEYDQLELAPIPHFSNSFIESKIKKGIREQLEAEVLLAPPLEAERASIMCRSCALLEKCIEVGEAEGYTMEEQKKYA